MANSDQNPSAALVTGQAPDLGLPPQVCLFEGALDPCVLIIFGATGDLTAIKLMPALYNLFLWGGLPSPCCIVGCARTALRYTLMASSNSPRPTRAAARFRESLASSGLLCQANRYCASASSVRPILASAWPKLVRAS